MTITAGIMIGSALALMVITVGCAAGVRLLTKRIGLSIIAGGLVVPASFLLGIVFFVRDLRVDDPPPGMVIGGLILAAAITTPLTMLVSFLTVRWIAVRGNRKFG